MPLETVNVEGWNIDPVIVTVLGGVFEDVLELQETIPNVIITKQNTSAAIEIIFLCFIVECIR